ncbi:MAG: hypothetical protein DIU75_002590 [Mycolicibacterium hassiacum]|jgi:hypothetical protein
MRLTAAVAAAVVTGATAVLGADPVAAEVVTLPERPDAVGVRFVDNPAIVDSHPLRPDAFSRVPGDNAVAVHFTTGVPECYGVRATVSETAEAVTVALRGGVVPEAVGRPCIMMAVVGTLEVPLAAPLGSRAVLAEF